MNDLNIAELKIGDRVGFCRTHFNTFIEKGFGIVTKINGHGHVTIILEGTNEPKFKVFDKYGNERNQVCSATTLCSAEWLEKKLAEQAAYNAKQRAVKDLLDYIGNRRYEINDEHKAEIKAEIKRLVDGI